MEKINRESHNESEAFESVKEILNAEILSFDALKKIVKEKGPFSISEWQELAWMRDIRERGSRPASIKIENDMEMIFAESISCRFRVHQPLLRQRNPGMLTIYDMDRGGHPMGGVHIETGVVGGFGSQYGAENRFTRLDDESKLDIGILVTKLINGGFIDRTPTSKEQRDITDLYKDDIRDYVDDYFRKNKNNKRYLLDNLPLV